MDRPVAAQEPIAPEPPSALAEAAKDLLEVIYTLDGREDLPDEFSGELIDRLRAALMGLPEIPGHVKFDRAASPIAPEPPSESEKQKAIYDFIVRGHYDESGEFVVVQLIADKISSGEMAAASPIAPEPPKLETGDSCYATNDAVAQGILPGKTILHVVRRNSKRAYMVRVTYANKSVEVHEDFLVRSEPKSAVEAVRFCLMQRFSDRLTMDEISNCAHYLAGEIAASPIAQSAPASAALGDRHFLEALIRVAQESFDPHVRAYGEQTARDIGYDCDSLTVAVDPSEAELSTLRERLAKYEPQTGCDKPGAKS